MTSLEMAGLIVTVCSLDKLRLARLDASTAAPAWPATAAGGAAGSSSEAVPVAPAPERATAASVLVLPDAEAQRLGRMVRAASSQ